MKYTQQVNAFKRDVVACLQLLKQPGDFFCEADRVIDSMKVHEQSFSAIPEWQIRSRLMAVAQDIRTGAAALRSAVTKGKTEFIPAHIAEIRSAAHRLQSMDLNNRAETDDFRWPNVN